MKIAMIVPDNRDEFRCYSDPEPYFGPAPTALLEGLAESPECEFHIVCCTHRPLRAPAQLARNIFFHSLLVPNWGWLRGGYLGCVRSVRRKVREIKPDLIHGQGTERYCALAAVHSGFPNVLTIHGNMRLIAKTNGARPFSFQWLAARLERVTLPKTDGVFCNSRHTEDLVRPLAKRTWLVPNALRAKFFAPLGKSVRAFPVLLNIGFIGPNKCQVEILEMARRMHGKKPGFELQFIGRLDETTPYGARFRDLIDQAQRQGYAKYMGEKSEDELIELMDKASALIHAPREEAFGLVVAEALARDLRLFGVKVGGLLDIAAGVEGAELVEAGNFSALEEAIMRWLSNGAFQSAGSNECMRERYHPDVIASRHVAIYREVAALRKTRNA